MAVPKGQVLTDAAVTATVAAMEAATTDAEGAAAAATAVLAAIEDAGSDAELHAQSVAAFTDSNAVNFPNGAKGYAGEADASASAAEAHEADAEAAALEASESAALATARAAGLALATPIGYIADNQTEVDAINDQTTNDTLFRTDTGALYEWTGATWEFRIQIAEGTFTTAASLDGIPGGAGARVNVYENGAGSTWDWRATNPLTGWTEAEDKLWVAASGSGYWVRRVDPGPVPLDAWGDDGADLETMIAAFVASNYRRVIHLPTTLAASDVIHIRKAGGQASVALIGANATFEGEAVATGITGTHIDFAGITTDRPGIAIQTGRGVRLSQLALVGPLDDYVTAWVGDVISHLYSDYTGDMGGASVSRESPFGGVVIDPYMSTAPGDPYPDTGFYGYTGGSAGLDLDNVVIKAFGAGVVIHPRNNAGTDANSSEIQLRISSFANAIGVSIGNTQARNVIIKELSNVTYGFVALTGLRHGRRLGPLPRVRALNTFGVYRLFEVNAGWGVVDVEGVHAELMGEIGIFGTGTTGRPMPGSIRACHFDYYINDASGSSISATPIYAKMALAFEGNVHSRTISDNDAAACTYNLAGADGPFVSFRGDSFLFPDTTEQICLFVSATARQITMEGCHCATGQYSQLVNTNSARYFPSSSSRRMYLSHWVRTVENLSDGTVYDVSHDRAGFAQGVSEAFGVDSWNWGTSTFHVTSGDGRRLFVGDRILLPCKLDTDPADNPWASGATELMPAAKITAYDTGTRVATFERLFHADAVDESAAITNLQVAVRLFVIDPAVTGDFTNASAVVDLNLPAGNVSDYFAAGDWVTTADGTTLSNAQTRVVSVNDGAVQMTLTHNAGATVAAQAVFNTRLTAA